MDDLHREILAASIEAAQRAATQQLQPLGIEVVGPWSCQVKDPAAVKADGRYGAAPVTVCYATHQGEASIGVYPGEGLADEDGYERPCIISLFMEKDGRWTMAGIQVAQWLSGRF